MYIAEVMITILHEEGSFGIDQLLSLNKASRKEQRLVRLTGLDSSSELLSTKTLSLTKRNTVWLWCIAEQNHFIFMANSERESRRGWGHTVFTEVTQLTIDI